MKQRTRMMLMNRRGSDARNRSGSFRVMPDGTRTSIYPGMSYPIMPYPGMIYQDELGGRFRDRKGRIHYDNGRYAPMNMSPGYVPPVYDDPHTMPQDLGYMDHDDDMRPMNKIGFKAPSGRHEMDQWSGTRSAGYAQGVEAEPLTREEAMEWARTMKNADGSTGAHWTMEQARQVMEQQKIQCDEIDFFVALNMMYSDYCKVAKKFNVSTVEFYACMAKAFLEDKDAEPDKLARYYDNIVRK